MTYRSDQNGVFTVTTLAAVVAGFFRLLDLAEVDTSKQSRGGAESSYDNQAHSDNSEVGPRFRTPAYKYWLGRLFCTFSRVSWSPLPIRKRKKYLMQPQQRQGVHLAVFE